VPALLLLATRLVGPQEAPPCAARPPRETALSQA
jgi:hypothetical protein